MPRKHSSNGFVPKKSLGQNFLVDPKTREKIIVSCHLNSDDNVLEIGPGKGALTHGIAAKVKTVTAVEKDGFLAEKLKEAFKESSVSVIHDDILRYPFDSLLSNTKIIGNLPYNIATPIIEKVFQHREKIHSFYITVQLEYGNRMVAKPDTKDYSPLSCFIQYYSNAKILFRIKNTCFSPAPKVQSCFLELTFKDKSQLKSNDEDFLFKIIRQTFQQRRKTLLNALSFAAPKDELEKILSDLKIKSQLRPENLTVDDYIKIADALKK
ncbi:MAG: ribosomal RNA small subunit methyltransferase A [Candidatus Omnitrophica bacterium]|nr:ribosomal RNA small subunit methyltransferase A [Candidatus Omnitrophota bacterium]